MYGLHLSDRVVFLFIYDLFNSTVSGSVRVVSGHSIKCKHTTCNER